MTQTQTETQSQYGRPLWAICPGCNKERRVKNNGRICTHNRYVAELKVMEYCDGSYSRPLHVTVWSQARTDAGKKRGKYNDSPASK